MHNESPKPYRPKPLPGPKPSAQRWSELIEQTVKAKLKGMNWHDQPPKNRN